MTTRHSTTADPIRPAHDASEASSRPDLATYRLVHRLLRDGAHRLAEGVSELDLADRRQIKAFTKYWSGYAAEVNHHHTVEDLIMFPSLVERVPGGAVALTAIDGDHHHLDVLIAHTDRELARVGRGRSTARLHALLCELADHMDEHLDVEDRDLLPLFDAHFTGAEYAAMEARIHEEVSLGKQALFTVPFIMAGATAEEGAALLDQAPPALRVVYRMTRKSHERLCATAFPRTSAVESAQALRSVQEVLDGRRNQEKVA
jgi:hemerythrin-like domain-containing protein